MAQQQPKVEVYLCPRSICSNMVSMTLAMGSDDIPESRIIRHEVDLFGFQQLDEEYLTKVNYKGLVPVLIDPASHKPISETKVIAKHLSTMLPSLFPVEHKQDIDNFLEELHSTNFFGMTYGGKLNGAPPDQSFAKGAREEIERRLALPSTSPEYAEALKKKLEVHQAIKVDALEPNYAEAQNRKVSALLKDMRQKLDRSGGPWIFGKHPTIVDAELAPLLARLRKPTVLKGAIIEGAGMNDYADMLLATPQWQAVGRQN